MAEGNVLVIIDVQKGFINEWTAHLPAAVEALQREYAHLVVTRFINPQGSAHRRLIGWSRFGPGSDDTELAFAPGPGAWVFDKATYTCLTSALAARLDQWGAETVDLCGIATENCVLKTAVDLFEAGRVPRVLSRYCASHGGADCHAAGLLVLRRFIGERQVV